MLKYGAIGLALLATPAFADDPAWTDLRDALYGDQFLTEAGDLIAINAPYRSETDSRTIIGAAVKAPPGKQISSVSVILDNNPMPVSAVIDLAEPTANFTFDVTMRVNGPTPLHIVAKTSDGQLVMAEGFVKTSGQGACAAPPGTDPKEALATLGQMQIDMADYGQPGITLASLDQGQRDERKMILDISHPSHSGMQMDQISLLYIPMRYVETINIDINGAPFAALTGSISLSENPRITLSVPGYASAIDVMMKDTDGTVATAHKAVAGL